MSHDVIRSVVNNQSACVDGTHYVFRLNWVALQQPAVEPVRDGQDLRQLLCIDAIPKAGPSRRRVLLHVVTRIGPLEELPELLHAALEQQLGACGDGTGTGGQVNDELGLESALS